MLSCAFFSITDYFRGKDNNLMAVVLATAFFLLLALFFFRMSLQIGKYQERARQSKSLIDIKAKEKDTQS
jgi:hypothetical protein